MSRSCLVTKKLETLLLMAVKQSGSYDPDETLHYIEESLTSAEYKMAVGFLTWIHQNKLTFGHGNIQERFKEYKNV